MGTLHDVSLPCQIWWPYSNPGVLMISTPATGIKFQTVEVFIKSGKIDGGITRNIFIHKELIYNRHDLSVYNEDTEALCLKIICKNNTI